MEEIKDAVKLIGKIITIDENNIIFEFLGNLHSVLVYDEYNVIIDGKTDINLDLYLYLPKYVTSTVEQIATEITNIIS